MTKAKKKIWYPRVVKELLTIAAEHDNEAVREKKNKEVDMVKMYKADAKDFRTAAKLVAANKLLKLNDHVWNMDTWPRDMVWTAVYKSKAIAAFFDSHNRNAAHLAAVNKKH